MERSILLVANGDRGTGRRGRAAAKTGATLLIADTDEENEDEDA